MSKDANAKANIVLLRREEQRGRNEMIISGGKPLWGEIPICGAKNSTLKVMVAAMMGEGTSSFFNVPNLADVDYLAQLLEHIGARVEREDDIVHLEPPGDHVELEAPFALARKTRAGFNILGPLTARYGKAVVPLPGGCDIGSRPVDLHLEGLRKMGATIELDAAHVHARAEKGLTGAHIVFPLISVGATEHCMMTACLAEGETVLENCAREPEISDLAGFLRKMGADISGDGTHAIRIRPATCLRGAMHRIMPDRIETCAYIMCVAMTGGKLTLKNVGMAGLGMLPDLFAHNGIMVEACHEDVVAYRLGERVLAHDVVTSPYPGFPTDLQASYTSMMAVAEGESVIREAIFENRFGHIQGLLGMGADIRIRGQRAIVRGVEKLHGTRVSATDLRASMCLVAAALCAEGETVIDQIHHLDRGFADVIAKLSACGARISRY